MNLPAVRRGGAATARQSLNAAGLQLFGNFVSNVTRWSPSLLEQVYTAVTGKHRPAKLDAVTVVAALGGVSRKTARAWGAWYGSLETKGRFAAFTSGVAPVGQSHEAVGSSQEAVGSPQDDVEAVDAALASFVVGNARVTDGIDLICDVSRNGKCVFGGNFDKFVFVFAVA